jgi:hypothetical protein
MATPSIQPSDRSCQRPTPNDTAAAAIRIIKIGSLKESKNRAQKPAKGGSGNMLAPYLRNNKPRTQGQAQPARCLAGRGTTKNKRTAHQRRTVVATIHHARFDSVDHVIGIDACLRGGAQLGCQATHTAQQLQQAPAVCGDPLHVQLACKTGYSGTRGSHFPKSPTCLHGSGTCTKPMVISRSARNC